MEILTSLEDVKFNKKTAVALGNFDGVHVGHRRILEDAVRIARENDMLAVCFTFSVHPKEVMDDGIRFISTEEDKMRMLSEIGIDATVSIPFDEKIMKTKAQDFIDDILCGTLNAGAVCCGFNYRFGDRASGDADMLREQGAKHGLRVSVHEPVEIDGETVSSTAIRELIEKGDMKRCAEYLGRPYSLSGRVSTGNSLGSRIGFPTANFKVPEMLVIPPNGVYFTNTVYKGDSYGSITNIGVKPTVGTYDKSVETNIFGFTGRIYGECITVEFLEFRRPEKKFANVDDLRHQIAKDTEAAKAHHKITIDKAKGL